MAVTVGVEAIEGDTDYTTSNYTYINCTGAADGDGTITDVDVYVGDTDLAAGSKIAIFYNTAGNNFTCRDAYTLAEALAAGAKRSLSGLSLSIQTGDFIGIFINGGKIRGDSVDVVSGYRFDYGDSCTPESSYAFSDLLTNADMSLYGYGNGGGAAAPEGVAAQLVSVGVI